MQVWYYVLIVNILLAFKLWWDSRAKNKYHRVINHFRSSVIDTTIYVVSSYLLFKPEWLVIIGWIFLAWFWRWLLFDGIYSKLNWGVWDFHGTSSPLDRKLNQIGPWHPLVKLIPLAIGLTLILI